MDVSIGFLSKASAEEYLPQLFDILYENMSVIAPSGESREEDWRIWHGAVAPALQKEPRQILLIRDGAEIIGYFQYYVNNGVFMMEEIQLRPEYQGRGIFRLLYRRLAELIPGDTKTVEAYAHEQNTRSRAILHRLGLNETAEPAKNGIIHYRGECQRMLDLFR